MTPEISQLILRPLHLQDERAFLTAQQVMREHDDFHFGFGYTPGQDWATYVESLSASRRGIGIAHNWVPTTFLIADVGGRIVGRTSVRHRLNEALTLRGGHIGYCVLPLERRRGYAIDILKQSLVIARAEGVCDVLVTCDEDNAGSRTVIETCGGELVDLVHPGSGEPAFCRYRIAGP